jgi:Putative peptidoglycan binding domain
MKMRHVFAVTSAALISFGAYAGGERQSSAGTSTQAATVRQAQERLASAGFEPTRQGLKEFQQSKGLEPSGQLDRETIAALGIDSDSSAGAGASSPSEPSPDATESSPERAAEPDHGGD